MWFKSLLPLIITGSFFGTTLMTIFMFYLSRIFGQSFNVFAVLGAMLTGNVTSTGKHLLTRGSIFTGCVAHYGIGLIFGITVVSLWQMEIVTPELLSSLLLGAMAGVLGAVLWFVYFRLYRYMPDFNIRLWLFCIFMAHIVFSGLFFLVYQLMY